VAACRRVGGVRDSIREADERSWLGVVRWSEEVLCAHRWAWGVRRWDAGGGEW